MGRNKSLGGHKDTLPWCHAVLRRPLVPAQPGAHRISFRSLRSEHSERRIEEFKESLNGTKYEWREHANSVSMSGKNGGAVSNSAKAG
jgi:hypothetical protein